MPFPKQPKHDFTLDTIASIRPHQPGVYGIFNTTHCIYVGQAEDIRESLIRLANREANESTWIFEHHPQYWQAAIIHKSQLSFWEKILTRELKPISRT